MKNRRRINEFYGKPRRHDFSFERVFNPQKSGTNAEYTMSGQCIKLGTNQANKLPVKEFIPHRGMNRRQRRSSLNNK